MRFALVLAGLATAATPPARAADVGVEDIFGRDLSRVGLTLVDWEGPIANPAIKIFIVPPADAAFPARAVVTSKEPRVYFNRPCAIGAAGSRKEVEFKAAGKQAVLVSIFPDWEGGDEEHSITVEFVGARGRKSTLTLPVRVTDQDANDRPGFPVVVDFSQDRTGFFKDEDNRKVVTRAARDWMYFFDPAPPDAVPAGKEKTYIWEPDAFKKGYFVTNAEKYTGYLLYAYGIQGGELRSGGEPSREGGFQSRGGTALTVRRSGGLEVETRGNYNTKGWMVSLADADYWKATNQGDVKNDLYSIVHHEIGHALVFNPANPVVAKAFKDKKFDDAAVREYLGSDPVISRSDHLEGVIDPASRCGAFGNEYHGEMPYFRWQITKLDLLCARAVGWPMRKSAPLTPLALKTETLRNGSVGKKYAETLKAEGGVPVYHWDVATGTLPPGLKLDSFTGEVAGSPTRAGAFDFTVRVRDYDERTSGMSHKFRVEIRED